MALKKRMEVVQVVGLFATCVPLCVCILLGDLWQNNWKHRKKSLAPAQDHVVVVGTSDSLLDVVCQVGWSGINERYPPQKSVLRPLTQGTSILLLEGRNSNTGPHFRPSGSAEPG